MYAYTTRLLKDRTNDMEGTSLPGFGNIIVRPSARLTVVPSGSPELLAKEAACCNKATD